MGASATGAPDRWFGVGETEADPGCALLYKRREQTHVPLSLAGLPIGHPDRYALDLLSVLFGEGMSSRLFLSLRERLGLAYDVHAYASNLLDTGAISIYLAVDPENADKALRATLDEVKQLRDGLSPPELHKILEYSKGRMLLSMEETRSVSAWYGGQALLRGTTRSVDDVVQELEAVREEDIVRVAEQLITDDSLRLAVVGPFDDADRFEQTLHL